MVGKSPPSAFFETDYSNIPNATTIGDIIAYFDKLYSYPVNRSIDWSWAYVLAAMNARDDDSDDRLTLVRFLRDYGSLPTSGYWVGVDAINEITIQDFNKREHRVKLSGITEAGIDLETKSKALNLMNVLRQSGWNKCESHALVSLEYPQQLFDKSGTLTANVIVSGLHTCVSGEKIQLSEIWGRKIMTYNLNHLLLRKGLAKLDTTIDPSWPKQKRALNDFLSVFTDEAKKNNLYIHGSKKDHYVELISEKLKGPSH